MHWENNIPDFDLLAAYLANEATPEQREQVEAWINSGNEAEFEEIKQTWQLSGVAFQDFDCEAALEKVNVKINKSSKKRKLWITYIAAAVIIALISIPMIILNLKTGIDSKMLIFASTDSISQISMSDGSKLTLNENSSIEYPKDFEKNRTIKLKGEAYFEVAHVSNENQFKVLAGEVEVIVVGTKFNIKAYEDADLIEVSVTEGIVKVKISESNKATELHANERAVFNKMTGDIVKDIVLAENEIYWKTNTIIFDNAGPAEIAAILSKIYDVDVEINLSNPDNYRITTEFTGNSLDEVIKILELTLDLKIRKESQRLIIEENE
ncbi:MAG: FecR family protein [Bacteroidales bacterium]|jgi:ferric-dicitrate binding protein FerR (iron transport regulator)|nr:FecR family protein [Bacteroidales bacterium]